MMKICPKRYLNPSDAESNLIVTYTFDKEKNNWIYSNSKFYFFNIDEYQLYDYSEELGPTIDNFKYTF